jgi:hypothetical protein
MEKRGIGEHGGRGETKALVILELLKSSFEAIRNGKKEGVKDGITNTALRVARTGFMPVSRSDLKWDLKAYGISTKNADAIIRALENDKAIKIKPFGIFLNILTLYGIIEIMEILTRSPYYIVLPEAFKEAFEIEKGTPGERPILYALDRAFAECFVSPYGDIPFGYYADPDGIWSERATRSVMEENKRLTLNANEVKEILEIATKLRGELSIKFKLLYVLRASMRIENGNYEETEQEQRYFHLSLSDEPRSFIEDPNRIMWGDEAAYIRSAMLYITRLVAMADDPNKHYLGTEVNKNEAALLHLKILLEAERVLPFKSLFENHVRYMDELYHLKKY